MAALLNNNGFFEQLDKDEANMSFGMHKTMYVPGSFCATSAGYRISKTMESINEETEKITEKFRKLDGAIETIVSNHNKSGVINCPSTLSSYKTEQLLNDPGIKASLEAVLREQEETKDIPRNSGCKNCKHIISNVPYQYMCDIRKLEKHDALTGVVTYSYIDTCYSKNKDATCQEFEEVVKLETVVDEVKQSYVLTWYDRCFVLLYKILKRIYEGKDYKNGL